uniref:Uncharacterized protein n=1 Tax=Cyanothece sp. (strain PCC 7425 / ATCC 29141) TaxID=395961 RepID=B8HNU5_CYAP4
MSIVSKFKRLFLVAGILVATIVPSLPVRAQTTPPPNPQVDPISALKLTPQQQSQIAQVMQMAQAQIKEILTPDQLTKLQTMSKEGRDPRQIFAALQLSPEQQTKWQGVDRIAQQQLMAILTPEQIKILQSMQQR